MDLDDADDEAWLLAADEFEAALIGNNGAAAPPPACDRHGDGGACGGYERHSDPTSAGMGGSLSADPRANALGAIKQTRVTDSFRDIRDDGELVITGFTPPSQTGGREVEEPTGLDGLHLKHAETLLLPTKVHPPNSARTEGTLRAAPTALANACISTDADAAVPARDHPRGGDAQHVRLPPDGHGQDVHCRRGYVQLPALVPPPQTTPPRVSCDYFAREHKYPPTERRAVHSARTEHG